MKTIGCFFGTFDPIHNGHIKLIDFFVNETDLDEVLIIITPLNPLKSKSITTKEDRLKMAEISLLNKKKSIAVVGSRKMSTEGSVIAKRVSEFFSSNDVNIVSGLALGIDTEAHNAALSAGGLTTAIVVDLKKINPPSNTNLAKKICKNDGLIMSENIPGTSSGEKYLFTMRNRLPYWLNTRNLDTNDRDWTRKRCRCLRLNLLKTCNLMTLNTCFTVIDVYHLLHPRLWNDTSQNTNLSGDEWTHQVYL